MVYLRGDAQRWCLEVAGQRIHGTTQRQPLVVFQDEERNALLPWDGEPYEITHWRTAKVHPDHHVGLPVRTVLGAVIILPTGVRRWKSGWTASWCASTTGASWSRSTSVSPKAAAPPTYDDYPAELSAYTMKAPDRIKRGAALLGPAVGQFAQRLFDNRHPWSRIRQGHKLIRLGDRYTPQRLDAACQRALAVDLIDVNRVERILVQALEQEATPQLPLPIPAGRFARPGSVFALAAGGRS